jgi:hypothetical protein
VRLNDPTVVAREYASEERFLARRVVFRDYVERPNAEGLAFAAVREAAPASVLEVGSGLGDFAARVGDVQRLPFGDGEFDCAVANWVLHHVPDLDGALAS